MITDNNKKKEIKVYDMDSIISQLEILSNQQRARIYFFILQQKKATTDELVELMNIQRSTLSYHLTKMVKADILEVSTPPTGRFKKTYSLPKEYMSQININLKAVFEENDLAFVKKYFYFKTLEHKVNSILIEIFNESIQNAKIKILSFDRDILKVNINNKIGFLPGIWKGDLTEKQALYVESQIESLIYDATVKFPEDKNDEDNARYNLILSQFPKFL